MSNEKLKSTLDWTPRYTSRESFEITMRAQGLLPPEEPVVADATTNGAATEATSTVA